MKGYMKHVKLFEGFLNEGDSVEYYKRLRAFESKYDLLK